MNYSTPEKQGIRSAYIKEYIEILEEANLSTHDVIIMRHGNIVFEKYWEPFHKDFLHRMYSVTKSFVALGIGFLEQDGLINLDDPIVKYFPDELKDQKDENLKNQTIRHMLMMSTAKTDRYWFAVRPEDRVKFYFDYDNVVSRPSGTIFEYDSTGSFVLGALIERISGKEFMEYLREKFLDKIGFSKEAYCLKCPGGHAWSDSALICKPTDLLKVAQFCMNKGKWADEQILNEEFVVAATSKQIDNNPNGLNYHHMQGYGYFFWRTFDNSFFLNGMGAQLAICVPDKDMILLYNADNQGHNVDSKSVIIDNFFRVIARRAIHTELPENQQEQEELTEYVKDLKLFSAKGNKYSDLQEKINNVTYHIKSNPMGIKTVKLCFEGEKGKFCYENESGYKELKFGFGYNEFFPFPQEGYSDLVGTQKGDRLYACATSAAWVTDYQLYIKVQIIDTYFGNANITIGFDKDLRMTIQMVSHAEDFLLEYRGFAMGEPLN